MCLRSEGSSANRRYSSSRRRLRVEDHLICRTTVTKPHGVVRRLLELDVGGADHLAPLFDLVTLERGELLGCAGDQIEAQRDCTPGDIGIAHRVRHLLVQAGDDRGGRAWPP